MFVSLLSLSISLQFADCAKRVMTHVRVNVGSLPDRLLVRHLQAEVDHLRQLLARMQLGEVIAREEAEYMRERDAMEAPYDSDDGGGGEGGEGGELRMMRAELVALRRENALLRRRIQRDEGGEEGGGAAFFLTEWEDARGAPSQRAMDPVAEQVRMN